MIKYDMDAIEYIAKIADGGMRDAITLMDKCLAYSEYLTLENVIKAIGTVDFDIMFKLTDAIIKKEPQTVIDVIESIHNSGKDLKLFIRSYMNFVLELCKYVVTERYDIISIPQYYELSIYPKHKDILNNILELLVKLNAEVKWDTAPKYLIEAELMIEVTR